ESAHRGRDEWQTRGGGLHESDRQALAVARQHERIRFSEELEELGAVGSYPVVHEYARNRRDSVARHDVQLEGSRCPRGGHRLEKLVATLSREVAANEEQ